MRPRALNRSKSAHIKQAVYYLTEPRAGAAERGKALFAPHGEQKNGPAVLELIKKRSQVATAEKVYRKYHRKKEQKFAKQDLSV